MYHNERTYSLSLKTKSNTISSTQNTTGKCENTRKQVVFVLVHVNMPYSRRLQRRNLPERTMCVVQNAKDKCECIVCCILCVQTIKCEQQKCKTRPARHLPTSSPVSEAAQSHIRTAQCGNVFGQNLAQQRLNV